VTRRAPRSPARPSTAPLPSALEQVLAVVPWSQLEGCYESGANLPPLYRIVASPKASAKARAKAWEDIWGALYHQDDVYTASLASVPVLAVLVHDAPTVADRREAAVLAGAVEMWTRARDVQALPPPVRRLFPKARAVLKKVAKKLLADPRLPKATRTSYASSRLALEGQRAAGLRLYRAQDEDDEDEDEDDRELVRKVRFKREKGLIYFLDLDGDIGVRRNVKGGVKSEKVLKLGVKREKGWVYQLVGGAILRTRIDA
jgi:hypothetical protein